MKAASAAGPASGPRVTRRPATKAGKSTALMTAAAPLLASEASSQYGYGTANQFETDAELNFAANAIQTARNTAKKSSIDNRALVRPLTGRLKR